MKDPALQRAVFAFVAASGVAVVIVSLVASILSSVSLRVEESRAVHAGARHRDIPEGWRRHEVPGGWIYERSAAPGTSALVVFVPRPASYAAEKLEVK